MHQEENMKAFVPSTNGVVRLPYFLTIFFDSALWVAITLRSDLRGQQFRCCLEHYRGDAPCPFPPSFLLPFPHRVGIIEHI